MHPYERRQLRAGDLAVDHSDGPLLHALVRHRIGYPQVAGFPAWSHRGLGVPDACRLQHPLKAVVGRGSGVLGFRDLGLRRGECRIDVV